MSCIVSGPCVQSMLCIICGYILCHLWNSLTFFLLLYLWLHQSPLILTIKAWLHVLWLLDIFVFMCHLHTVLSLEFIHILYTALSVVTSDGSVILAVEAWFSTLDLWPISYQRPLFNSLDPVIKGLGGDFSDQPHMIYSESFNFWLESLHCYNLNVPMTYFTKVLFLS